MKERTLIVAHEFKIGAEHRRSAMGHQSLVVWMTGLSGSGKSTIADLLEQQLFWGWYAYLCSGRGQYTHWFMQRSGF